MLDPHGFVATCNSVNFFIVRDGEVWTATTKYQMPGITRAHCIELCRANGILVRELDFSLTQVQDYLILNAGAAHLNAWRASNPTALGSSEV